jgi:octaprenyl-diphosphate synthase
LVTARRTSQARAYAADDALGRALQQVEVRLGELLRSREPLLTDISSYLVDAGGKRVRPAVTLLTYRACGGGGDFTDIVDVATALELIHSATLLHDDIIDNSDIRRGKDSALRKFGLSNTLVTGDFVFSRAFQLCARFEEKLINWAAEGEVMQGRFRHNADVTLDDYLEIISRKTASIFQQGARTAAYLAGAPETMVEAMASCGFNVGMTFQIVDDVLDVDGKQAQVGKPVGLDLRDGNPSLPIVLAVERDAELAQIFETAEPSETDVARALQRVRASGVLPEARRLASVYADRARDDLDVLAPSSDKDHLRAMVDQLVDRVA